jgi:hypothetical protein
VDGALCSQKEGYILPIYDGMEYTFPFQREKWEYKKRGGTKARLKPRE